MSYRTGDVIYFEFTTRVNGGAVSDADTTPVATANHNGTDDGSFTLTVTHLDTGRYVVSGTVPSGYSPGDTVNITVAATVSGVNDKSPIGWFVVQRLPSIPKNKAIVAFPFLMTDSTTHAPKPGLGSAVTVTRSLDGNPFSTGALGIVNEIANGWYFCSWAASDTNAAFIAFRATATNADDLDLQIPTTP